MYAQQHQWTTGGGSFFAPPVGYNARETVHELATDDNGNLYALVEFMGQGSINFGGTNFNLQSPVSSQYRAKTALLSYNCAGQLRWGKIIEGNDDIRILGLVYDGRGNVYIAGAVSGGGSAQIRYFDSDSTMYSNFYASWLIKYDTLGNYKWMRAQGENTASSSSALGNRDGKLVMSDTLIHYVKSVLVSGVQLMPGVTSLKGIYDFVYTPSGNLLSATKLGTDTTLILNSNYPVTIHDPTGELYLTVLKHDPYGLGQGVAVFDASRNLISYDTIFTTGPFYGGSNRVCVFREGDYKYVFGSNTIGSGASCTFMGQSFTGTINASGHRFSFVMKLDMANNLVWRKQINPRIATGQGIETIYGGLHKGKLILSGIISSGIIVGSDTLVATGNKPPIVILDTLGNLQKMDYWQTNEQPPAIDAAGRIAVHNGSIYLGGIVTDSIWGGSSGYRSRGGPTDFFVGKYGYSCNCAPPASSFTQTTSAGGLISFAFTGTTTGIDSVVWAFGDGTTATGIAAAHTYAPGNYTACATVYNSCGPTQACQPVSVACAQPNAAFTYTTNNTMLNTTYTGSTPVDSIRWTFGNGATASGSTATQNYTQAGTYNVCAIAYRGCGGDTICQAVTVTCPVVTAAYSYTANNTTLSTTYTGSTPVDSIRWTFGNGATASGSTAMQNYTQAGTYNVCAIAYRGCGRDTACQAVTVICPAPAASFTHTANALTASVTYTGTTPVDSVTWSFGDGTTATGNTAGHTYTTEGTYMICATAYNICGSDSICQSITLQTTGIGNIPGSANISLYPNPANQSLIIADAPRGTLIEIYNSSGKRTLSATLRGGKDVVDVSNMAAGVYLIRFTVKEGGQSSTARFVKR